MNNRSIGRWIEIARTFRGFTQKEFAEMVDGLQQSNLSKMEKGLLPISEATLERISHELGFPVDFFKEEQSRLPISDFYFRKRITMSVKETAILEAGFDIFRSAIDNLLDEFEIPDLRIPNYDVEERGITPQDAAIATRRTMQLGQGPVVDIIDAIERNGIVVYEMERVPEKFDGITLISNKGFVVIIINKNLPSDRKRFTLAHELGHFVLHTNAPYINKTRDIEKEANTFASEFMFPEQEAMRVLQRVRFSDLQTIKSQWLISKAAIVYKAAEIGAISEVQKKNLMIELSRFGERKNEKGEVGIDSPKIINEAISLFREMEYDSNDLSRITKLPSEIFSQFFLKGTSQLRVSWRNNSRQA